VVQEFEDYGAELYAQIRKFSLSNSDTPKVQDITGATIGARVKF